MNDYTVGTMVRVKNHPLSGEVGMISRIITINNITETNVYYDVNLMVSGSNVPVTLKLNQIGKY